MDGITAATDHDDIGSLSQASAAVVTQVFAADDFNYSTGPALEELLKDYPELADNSVNMTENSQSQQESQVSVPATGVKPRQKHNRMVFNNKKLQGNRQLFMLEEFQNKLVDDSVFLNGKIVKCATKKDKASEFVIDWDCDNLPSALDVLWLKTNHANTDDHMQKLQEATLSYEELSAPEHAKKKKKDDHGSSQNSSRRRKKETMATPVGNNITIAATKAAASIQTSSSIVSTLTRNSASANASVLTFPSSSRGRGGRRVNIVDSLARHSRSTRSNDVVDSDSDNGDNLDEDDRGVDNVCTEDDSPETQAETEEDIGGVEGCTIFELLSKPQLNFEVVPENVPILDVEGPMPYNGPTGLKPGVAESFNDPLECLAVNGLNQSFVAHLAQSSNEYTRRYLLDNERNSRLHGIVWKNISVEEMYCFLGITLCISLLVLDGGGYHAHFRKKNIKVCGEEVKGTKGFARKHMQLWRYKQMRSAFHRESRKAAAMDGRGKAFMLRLALCTLNEADANVMNIPEKVSFDEGGTGSRHRHNPIRLFNGSKPVKFRIEYFILSCSKIYFIHHSDVYQGKNAADVHVHKDLIGVPTTQKVVLNSTLHTKMDKCVHGACHIYMDNWCQCPQLAAVLLKRYSICCTGTCQNGRKGWNKHLFNLKKSQDKGTRLLAVDRINGLFCAQWVDSKVVNCVSLLINTTIEAVKRQNGSEKDTTPCPAPIVDYQKHMFGVDKGDQMRSNGGFALKAHFKKWYKRGFFAVLDMMLMNACISWNTSCRESPEWERTPLKRHNFYWCISQRFLNYTENDIHVLQSPEKKQATAALANSHKPE